MYIDAGTGSMLVQALAAAFFTFIIFFKQIINAVKRLFSRKGKNDREQ